MSTKHTESMKAFQTKYNLSFQNFFTIGSNPKIEKNNIIENIPTACLMLLNTDKACSSKGSCSQVCLIASGNPIYYANKMQCRIRRNNALMSDYISEDKFKTDSMFLRYLIINCFRFYSKNRSSKTIAFRLNGVSDWSFEKFPIKLTKEDTDYILKAFNIYIEPIEYSNVFEAVNRGLDLELNQSCSIKTQYYDYTKKLSRDFKLVKSLKNYHLTLSHGSSEDTFLKALELNLNYAAAFNLKKSEALPKTFTYRGKVLNVIDGDLSDCRFLDIDTSTHIVGLRFKIVKNQNNAKKLEFCIDTTKEDIDNIKYSKLINIVKTDKKMNTIFKLQGMEYIKALSIKYSNFV